MRTTPPRTDRSTLRHGAMMLAMAVLAGVSVRAQSVDQGSRKPQSDVDEEIIELSPFTVSSESDKGYVATSSVAGTKLRTRLDEIPAAISVVTKEMMSDLGVHNSGQLLSYTLGTEVSGSSGNFTGAATSPGAMQQDSVNRNLLPTARIRGLANADNTRDYFLSDIPWDSFSTDRVEVNRGPNAMLFGTGSPAGIINQATIQANPTRNATTAQFEYGEFGTMRGQIDTNQVLIKHKLAIRAAAKLSNDKFMQEEAYVRDSRGFVAGVYRPTPLTTIRGNFEQGRQSSVKPQWRPPFDLGVESWFKLGKPSYDPTTWTTKLTGTSTAKVPAVYADGSTNWSIIQGGGNGYGWGSDNPVLVFDQPDKVGTSLYGVSGLYAITNRGPGDSSLHGLPGSRELLILQHAGEVGASAWGEQQISDPKIFDFYNHLLEGRNKPEGAKWNVYTLSLEQLLPDKSGGVEIAYNKESVRSSYCNPFNWESYGIGIDINSKLLNGATNPNFGRPVIESDSWSTESLQTRENTRITAFYSFDFSKVSILPNWLAKVLGAHTFTGNYASSRSVSITNGGRALIAGPEWVLSNPNVPAHTWNGGNPPWTITNGAARAYQSTVYLGDATAGNDPRAMNIRPVSVDVLIPNVNSVNALWYDKTASAWKSTGLQVIRGSEFDKSNVNLSWTGGGVKTQTSSKVAILHSNMLYETILPTIGYREDTFKSYNADGDYLDSSGFYEYKSPIPSQASSVETEYAFNYGLVGKLPKFLNRKLPAGLTPSVFFNKSDNFSPTGQRVNIFGQAIDPSKGKTKEYGVMLTALDNDLVIRLTEYETSLTGTSVDMRDAIHSVVRDGIGQALGGVYNSLNDTNPVAKQAFLDWWSSAPLAANIRNTFEYKPTTNSSGAVVGYTMGNSHDSDMRQTTDSVSKGHELEVTYNVTKDWRLSLIAARAQVTNENSARDAYDFLTQIQPVLNGSAGQVWLNDAHRTWAQSANSFVQAVNSAVYGDGQPVNPELRKNRFAMLTNYSFSSGILKHVGVGGAVRWADKILLGTGYKASARGDIPDYSVLYYGPAETTLDLWVSYWRGKVFRNVNWSLQLNLRNVGVGKKLIPVSSQPDGGIATWRIAEPMTWTLTSKFEF